MTTFRIVSAVCIMASLSAVAADLRLRLGSWNAVMLFVLGRWTRAREIWAQRAALRTDRTLTVARRVFYMVTLPLFLALAVTAFVPVLFLGERVSGVLLVIHVTIAPFFSLFFTALALLWAHRLRLHAGDWHVAGEATTPRTGSSSGRAAPVKAIRLIVKAGFWFALVVSLPLMLSIILGLYPLFGTEGQEYLMRIHGYSALALFLIVVVHTYILLTYVEGSPETFVKEDRT
jgi:hypothetical protein